MARAVLRVRRPGPPERRRRSPRPGGARARHPRRPARGGAAPGASPRETTDFEAKRSEGPTVAPVDYGNVSWRVAAGRIARTPTAWIMAIAASVGLFASTGLAAWVATFFRRFHAMNAAQAGAVTVVFGIVSLTGLLVGSRIGDRLMRDGRGRDRVKLAALCYAAGWAFAMPGFALNSTPASIALLSIAGFLISIPIAPLWAMWLDILVPQLRGRADAFFSIIRVIAISTAPLVIGAVSDAADLRIAFLVAMPVILLNAGIILLALNSYPRDAARAQADALAQADFRTPAS
ncbi:MAG: MFS transporter [Acidimicrobiia bacterium]|nr:MFS transporter [Acidimicrobiia bacterium]